MSIIKQEFDPIYETIMLLYQGYDVEMFKKTVVAQINEMGGNGEDIYQMQLKVFDKYLRTFNKNRVTSDRDEFYFKDTSTDFFTSFMALFLVDKSLVYSIDQMNNNQIVELMFQYSNEIFEMQLPVYSSKEYDEFMKAENMIAFVNRFDMTENEKWKTFLILQNPSDYYGQFAKLIRDNIHVYENAMESIKPSLDKQMELFDKTFSDEEKMQKFMVDNNMKNCDIQEFIPSMASAYSIVISSQTCYYGLLFDKVLTEFGLKSNGTKEYLMTCLKALSDRSKFEIMTSLKSSPKYATELATQLELTPATVSHHMSTLLASQMVYLEKENGKYYYHVDEATINKVIEQLRQALL